MKEVSEEDNKSLDETQLLKLSSSEFKKYKTWEF